MSLDRNARIVSASSWGGHRSFRIDSPAMGAAAEPGQFVMVKVSAGPAPLLRRPFGVHDAGPWGIEIFFKTAGKGTAILAEAGPGDRLDILGPLGRGFSAAGMKGGSAMLVGGGRGIAPLYFLARRLLELGIRISILYGGRTESDLPLRDKLKALGAGLLCSTDDGTFGAAGLVTDLAAREMRKDRPDMVYACGPDPMMKALAAATADAGVKAEFSLESVMGCGIGACWGCVHRIRNEAGSGWVKICESGPVFPADMIVWTE